ncbi:MAG: IS3 family transposase, partial [Clostridia bacterium]|nr:IS3 family transposase [Clostridia bacterium]
YDNAAMENFFGTLKCECLNRMQFANRDEVKAAVAEYIQFYNFERINMKTALLPMKSGAKPRKIKIFCDRCFLFLSNRLGVVYRDFFICLILLYCLLNFCIIKTIAFQISHVIIKMSRGNIMYSTANTDERLHIS